VVSFLSLSPSFLGGRGGGDEVVVVVVCVLLMVYDKYYQSLRLIVRWCGCVLTGGKTWNFRLKCFFLY
jgi:hypothetical protein